MIAKAGKVSLGPDRRASLTKVVPGVLFIFGHLFSPGDLLVYTGKRHDTDTIETDVGVPVKGIVICILVLLLFGLVGIVAAATTRTPG